MSVLVHDSVVRLTMADFEALVAGELPECEERPALEVPGMAAALSGVRHPLLALQVDVAVAAGGRTHLGWVGADALALLLPLDGEVWQLMALPIDQVAASLARIVGLGPGADRGRATRELSGNPFDQFFSADGSVRSEALAAHDVDVAWTLGVRSQTREWLMAAAAGTRGSWLYEPRLDVSDGPEQPMTARPVSATEIYRRFTAIVPGLLQAA